MILVTGGTGFIGRALIRHLVETDHQVRTLIRPSPVSPNLPRGVPIEVAVSGLEDERSLRAAMVGVDTIYHLASGEWRGVRTDLLTTDIQGTQSVLQAAQEAGVKRFFYLSHLGADRASAFPVLKAKAIAEEHIRRSGLEYTILRSGIVFGPTDHFTTGLVSILAAFPFFFIVPGEGDTLLQPIWVEDLVTCLVWALENIETQNQTLSVGGPEFLSIRQIMEIIMQESGIHRKLAYLSPPYLRGLTVFLEHNFPELPVSVFWLDYLATSRTASLDTLPRVFNLLPARFSHHLAYLKGKQWRVSLWRYLLRRQPRQPMIKQSKNT